MAKKDKKTSTEAAVVPVEVISAAPADTDNKKRKREKTKSAAATPSTPAEEFSLFGKVNDVELDDVFSKGTAYARPVEVRKIQAPVASSSKDVVTESTNKKAKVNTPPKNEGGSSKPSNKGVKPLKAVPKPVEVEVEVDDEDDEDEDDDNEEDDDEEDEDEDDNDDLTHEAVKNAPKKVKVKSVNVKYTPPSESAQDRDRRTVFVGNLPIEIAKSKSVENQLRTHLQTFAPTSKIESIRYRSVAFAAPTSDLPTDDAEKDQARRAKREKERVEAWKASQDEGGESGGIGKKGKVKNGKGRLGREDDEVDVAKKIFLDEKGKRKVAFIKKDFHSELESCNAYIVFAHPHPDRPSNVAPILDPYEAAKLVLSANGTSFQNRTIRVDTLRLPSSVALANATTALTKRDAWLPSGTDPKKSLFVGGLDYASKDEDVRVFFEELVKAERGVASEGGRWVVGVRLIRDRETQLGKGFGYVHFTDRESADEILALDSKKLKFAKKPLRVQPCKTLPPSATYKKPLPSSNSASTSAPGTAGKPKPKAAAPQIMPKGNPLLGEKIKDLPKDERKLVKSTDADRLARRLAKKKLRGGMEREAGAVRVSLKRGDKERAFKAPKAKKGRVRSGNALRKMKGSRV